MADGDLKDGIGQNGTTKGHIQNGDLSNVDVPVASRVDGMTLARKALFQIGEGLQEKVSAFVNSAAMAAKSATSDNVCYSYIIVFLYLRVPV